jgi:propionyl-CoA carboxylase beta chain
MLGNLDFAGEALSAVSVIADNGVFLELSAGYAPVVSTVLTSIGGVKCGVVATSFSKDEGRITADAARKIAKFVNLCDSFSLPVVTLVDSYGLAIDGENETRFAPELAKLAVAYASATCPKVTVICGHAIGASFVLLGSKALGADLVYATDSSEIGALVADSGVAFAWDKYITEETTRESLVEDWKTSVSSPVCAASSGEIDDIISVNEMRARICSALLMLAAKGDVSLVARRKVLPL